MVRFRICGSPPKRRFHKLQLNTAVPFAFGVSSADVKPRPMAGFTPRGGTKSHEIFALLGLSGSWPPDAERPAWLSRIRAMLLKVVFSLFHASKTPPATWL